MCNIKLFFCIDYFFLNILWNKVYIFIMSMLEDIELWHNGRKRNDVSIQRVIVWKGGLWDIPILVRFWYYLDFDWREWHHLKSLRRERGGERVERERVCVWSVCVSVCWYVRCKAHCHRHQSKIDERNLYAAWQEQISVNLLSRYGMSI